MANYVCLACGATTGSPAEQGMENWYWKILENGKVGPFHCENCARLVRIFFDESPQFSLREYDALHFLRHQYRETQTEG